MTPTKETELTIQRRKAKQRAFLTGALRDDKAPRLAPALRACREMLSDGQWHGYADVLATALQASDVKAQTITVQLSQAIGCGALERRGEYVQRTRSSEARDSRELRLLDWPKE